MTQLTKYLPWIILLLLLFPSVRPLFHSGLFTMHDDQQVVRLAQMDKALQSGQLPVRWVSDLGFGYGYPLFNFYPPLVYYIGQITHLLFTLDFINSVKVVFGLSLVLSAVTMYLWSRLHFGRLAGLISALFYVYAPYRAVDVYVRGAMAESFSFVWLPLIFLAIDHFFDSAKAKDNRKVHIWSLIFALSYAGLMITHNLIVLPFSLLIAFYVSLKLLLTSKSKTFITSYFILATLMGLGLSAFFWLPALWEKKYTLVDSILLTQRYSHEQHYVEPAQLWNSIWGYGGSSPDQLDGFSLKIGKLHIILSIAALMGSLLLAITNKQPKRSSFKAWLIVTCSFLLTLSSFMTTRYSAFIWDTFTPLQFLQFPWRFLTFTALFSSLLAGACVYILNQQVKNSLIIFFYSLILVILLFLPNIKLFQPQTYLNVTDGYYASDEFTKWKISKTSFEFIPKQVTTRIEAPLNITQIDIDRDQIATVPVTTMQGDASIKIKHNTPDYKEFEVEATSESIIRVNSFYFPGWKAFIDNRPVTIENSNHLYLIDIRVPKGLHTVQVVFTDTPVRAVANTITLLATILVVIITLRYTVYVKIRR